MRLALAFAIVVASLGFFACGSAPPPLPSGPGPEYEASPIYSAASTTSTAPTSPTAVTSAAPAIVDAGLVLPILDHEGGA